MFTNNLDISCVLSGADPFDGVTVSSGATALHLQEQTRQMALMILQ